MQEQVSSKVQDNKVTAAHESNNTVNNNESTSEGKGKRTERKTQAQIIVEFLSRLGAYEADAIRIALALGKESVMPQSLSPEDKLCINRYLNVGLQKENVPAERVGSHRTMRAIKLVERLIEYADKSQLTKANFALAMIAMDAQDVENARKLLAQGRQGRCKMFARDLAAHGITLTERKDNNGKTIGIVFTMDGMSFAGGRIDKGLSFGNVMLLIDSYRRLYPERAMFWDAKDNCPEDVRPFIVQASDGNTKVEYFQEPQPFQSDLVHFIDNPEMASNNNSIVSNIADAAVEIILQPTVAPTPSVGGGSNTKHDDDDERKKKNKNHPTKRTGWRR